MNNKKRLKISIVLIIGIFICVSLACIPYIKKILSKQTNPSKEVTVQEVSYTEIPEYSGAIFSVMNDNKPFFDVNGLSKESFEAYWELDALGRCKGAVACLGQELMPEEERGSIAEVKPSGWQSIEYEFVDQKSLYNRCHLIGYQLTGENANPCNLITGTRYMNVEGMLPFECSVAEYIRNTNNHVYYMVRPIFDGNELVARGVLMEAYSIEDEGKGICFNVFCYNVQPGVIINYADGSSYSDGSIAVESTSDSSSYKYDEETAKNDAAKLYDENGTEYVLNTRRMKIHRPDCKSVQDMSPKNTYEIKSNMDILVEAGYSACQNCKPE